MSKHTKGEWVIETDGYEQLVITANDRALAFLPRLHPDVVANSKLIAAAPDLLEALQSLVKEVDKMCPMISNPEYYDMLKKWQAAWRSIQKATA